jgi:2-polyprenyl-3-methyl-5-hydroxy-6-metoxy-1,4-benzoquinol methylase
MFYLRPNSLRTNRPTYSFLDGGAYFIPVERVGLDYASTGIYEQYIIDFALANLVDSSKNVIDVGAHVGLYTVPLARKAKHVYSFECCIE